MISIIIVGYNSEKYLGNCMSSIFSSSYKKFRVIFVDNDSKDNSIECVKKNFGKVVIIKNKENLGFAAGNNIGIREALKLKSDYIFLLNPDTIIDKQCLEKLANKASGHTILQPLILISSKAKKTDLVNTSGNYLNFLGFSYVGGYKEKASEAKDSEIPIASGAGALIPSSAFAKAGFFDEKFFLYHEDVDLFWRFRLAGYQINLAADAKIWHEYSFGRNKNKMFYAERNRLLFLYKNFSTKYLLLILLMFILNELLMLFYSLIDGWFLLKIKSYFSVASIIGDEISARKKNLSFNHKSEKILKKYIGATISFSEITSPLFYPYNAILRLYWKLIYSFI